MGVAFRRFQGELGERIFDTLPKGARAAPNGGLSEAASGNLAIAAVTSWSRAAPRVTTCAVPVGGAAPSDASVRESSVRPSTGSYD